MVKNPVDEKMCGGGKRINHLRSDNTGRRNKQVRKRNSKKNLKGRIFYKKVGGSLASVNDNKGLESVFTDDMTQREFGCRQPNWDVKCT